MGRLARHLRDILFPPRCSVCGDRITDPAASRAMCHVCYEKYGAEVRAGCAVCGRDYVHCICHPEPFFPDEFVFALPYNKLDGVCRKLILSCKNRKNTPVMEEFAAMTVSAAAKRGILTEDVLLTYIPRAPEKELHTGVDQAKELAKAIAKRTGLSLHTLLGHHLLKNEQKNQPYALRMPAAEEAYYLLPGVKNAIAGRTVLLVDDVVTTGATVNSCTALLKEAGAKTVICLAAARSIKSDREFMR